MATPAMAPSGTMAATPPNNTGGRGKHQINWSEHVWQALDHAVREEMLRTRVAAKFLPHAHVEKKQTNVASDIVNVPTVAPVALVAGGAAPPFDPALSVDESQTTRVQEYWVTFKMSVAQVEAEEHAEALMMGQHSEAPRQDDHGAAGGAHPQHHQMMQSHRASTGVSLAMRTANVLAQAEDLILFNGKNAFNSPLFTGPGGGAGPLVQYLDPNLSANLDTGLLNINAAGNVVLPNASQVIVVHPTAAGTAVAPPIYAEATLNAVASAFSVLQGLGHYEHYGLVLHTVPYADLHQALKATLIEPVEPISHLIKAGIYGTGTLPPFTPVVPGPPIAPAPARSTGLPIQINGAPIAFPATLPGVAGNAQVLYTGVLVSLSGNTMDHVRGKMEDHLDVIVTFNQKDANEQYRFRVVERFCLRLKDPTAVCLMLFMDS
jgi:hypothetical protein